MAYNYLFGDRNKYYKNFKLGDRVFYIDGQEFGNIRGQDTMRA